jgi:transcription antitermination factor NusG
VERLHVDGQSDSTQERWFALRVKTGAEKVVASIARNKGFEEFLPLYHSRRRWSDRTKALEVPVFTGYIFCRLDPVRRLPLLTIPSAMHFVGIGYTPSPIEETEIAAIRTAVESGLYAEPWPFLESGQHVQIEKGPLSGLEGILVQHRKEHRLVVSVSLLRRSLAVEVDREWVTPVRRLTPMPALGMAQLCGKTL